MNEVVLHATRAVQVLCEGDEEITLRTVAEDKWKGHFVHMLDLACRPNAGSKAAIDDVKAETVSNLFKYVLLLAFCCDFGCC